MSRRKGLGRIRVMVAAMALIGMATPMGMSAEDPDDRPRPRRRVEPDRPERPFLRPDRDRERPFRPGPPREFGRRQREGRREPGGLEAPIPLNPIDHARYAVARILLRKEQTTEAIKELEQVTANSPDRAAVAWTHLNMARLYRDRLGDVQKAVAEYRKVEEEAERRTFQQLSVWARQLNLPTRVCLTRWIMQEI